MACEELIASVDDVALRMHRAIDDPLEIRLIEALLADASSMVRQITGQQFSAATVTATLPVLDGAVFLAANDIADVSSVTTLDGTALAFDWDGRHRLTTGAPEQFDLELVAGTTVIVTYTRDDDVAPQWVVGIVAQMAARAFGRPADQSGVQQETIAGYSYSVGAAAAAGGVGLLPYEEARLREAYPPPMGTAWLAVPSR